MMYKTIRAKLRAAKANRLCALALKAADEMKMEEGMRNARAAIMAAPDAAAPHFAMGRVWDIAGEFVQSEASYRRAIALDPGHAKACNNLGAVLVYLGRLDEALACYRQARLLDPDQPEANRNIAILTKEPAAWEAAIRGYLGRTAADPADSRAHGSLGDIYRGLGRLLEARASLDRAIALDPDNAEARYSRALLLLTSGDYTNGWRDYESRWRIRNQFSFPAHRFAGPVWDGRAVDGAVLLHGEMALGESLQFVRYARLVAGRAGRVNFECAPRLKPLLEGVEGVAQVLSPGEPMPDFTAHVPLYTLPRLFGTTLETIPWQGPYIHADPRRVEASRPMFESVGDTRIKVGLAWSGNAQNAHDRERSIEARTLAPLANVQGIAWYSLQAGHAAANPPTGMGLVDLASQEPDFRDLAAYIENLDIVVTVDTSIAHLAGALGARTWVLLNRMPDWRFHLERSDNPWYPSMRLFRQAREGDWTDVIERVSIELGEMAARGRVDPA